MPKKILLTSLTVMLALALCGCELPDQEPPPKPVVLRHPIEAPKMPPEVAGTIAERALIVDHTFRRVEGYGLVIGLGKNGSTEIPPGLDEYFNKYFKKRDLGSYMKHTADITPLKILRSGDCAIVRVIGYLPPGVRRGGRFDLEIQALPETQTKSLEGGILMPTEMFLFRAGKPLLDTGAPVEAMAAGPVFISPYIDHTKPEETAKCRDGRVIGGGEAMMTRQVKMLLYTPDHAMCDRVARKINERYGEGKTYAKGADSQLLNLDIPPMFGDDVDRFTTLVLHTPVSSGAAAEKIAHDAAELMENPGTRYEDLSLLYEAMGKQYLNVVRAGYTSKNPSAAYYSARAGLRLGNDPAAEVILKVAATAGPLQLQAIEELGRHRKVVRAAPILRELLQSDDNDVRLAAYNSLLKRVDPAITTISIDSLGGKFNVDLVPSGKYIVYASQTNEPRIALFGQKMSLRKPVFFNSDDDLITMKADPEDNQVLMFRKILQTNRRSDYLYCDFDVAAVVKTLGSKAEPGPDGKCPGLGLTYSQVVTTLQGMCKQGQIPGKFVLQKLTGSRPKDETTGLGRPDMVGEP